MCETAGFTQLHSQSADLAELMWRMTSPLDAARADGERFHVASGIALGYNGDLVWPRCSRPLR
jgi:hypothetical protein